MSRHTVRERVLQTLFQMDLNRLSPQQAAEYTRALLEEEGQEAAYFELLLDGILSRQEFIDQLVGQYADDWAIDRMPGVDRNILRIGAYELIFAPDVPPAVVLDEAVELSKEYGTDRSPKFINGVLAGMLKELMQLRAKATGPTAP